MNGVSLTMMTREGIRTYAYECHTPSALAAIVQGTVRLLDERYGETLVTVEVN